MPNGLTVSCRFRVGFFRTISQEALVGVSSQICSELNKSLVERGYSTLSPAQQDTLTGQICSIAHKDNPIRTLVGMFRILHRRFS